ncbi:MAG: PAS domain S-box protein [Candidatus Abyssobacteria bacterium SURF_5]|uniref:histidine kinase n=1 Tax=Abyssobacteria bacterium (strain SURF_5) TaxID=2093360 RepID=A0A3A4NZC9_ABYX5|nr:MAG: PAS domain S-box protein [Candidatus Abyssubacteria bacterium SURF_5]
MLRAKRRAACPVSQGLEPSEATREQAEKIRAVVSAIADPFLIYGLGGVLTGANEAAASIFGFNPIGLTQLQILRLIDLTQLDGRKMNVSDMASARALRGEIVQNVRFTFRDRRGDARYALASAAPIREGDRITGAVAYWLDVTEQRKTEAALEWEIEEHAAMAELAKALLRSASLEDISCLVLEYAKRLTGSRYGIVGYLDRETGDFVCPTLTHDIWSGCRVEDKKFIFKGVTAESGLAGWVWENKEPLLTNSPATDARSRGVPSGHVPISRFLGVPAMFGKERVGMIGLANPERDYCERDMVVAERLAALYAIAIERKWNEDRLHASREEYRQLSENLEKTVRQKVADLQQAERLAVIGQTVSVVAHEIRNPLQNISLGLEAIRAGVGADGDMLDTLADMEAGVDSLNRLVEEILEYARPVTLRYSSRPLHAIIDTAVHGIGRKLEASGVKLVLNLENGSEMVTVDPDKMARALVNLMSNSIEAMPKGGVITISSCTQPRGKTKYLFLTISDTGRGIAPEDLDRIYEPFFTTKSKGTGLGLAICRKIIEGHKGSLWFRSELGNGTTADICMPVTMPDASAAGSS